MLVGQNKTFEDFTISYMSFFTTLEQLLTDYGSSLCSDPHLLEDNNLSLWERYQTAASSEHLKVNS